ncbi:MAG: transposase [Gammaproteobacteria bacterium]|nr:transposase [Gammaproteobacteria bacterium]
MPRKPRMYLPDVPCHVITRGNNRGASFFADQDYLFYLDCLKDASRRYGVLVHAYVLMTNHVHLLVTSVRIGSISRAMQSIGRRYVQYVNREYRRTGTLWEGRHKASLVDQDRYLLTCMRYIELNPVRAHMVVDPADYRWSSYRRNANGESNELIRSHELYKSLGVDDEERAQAYRSLFINDLSDHDMKLIRESAQFSMPTGDSWFKQQIETAVGRKIGYAQRGRPCGGSDD